jgi:hypothetical protein
VASLSSLVLPSFSIAIALLALYSFKLFLSRLFFLPAHHHIPQTGMAIITPHPTTVPRNDADPDAVVS